MWSLFSRSEKKDNMNMAKILLTNSPGKKLYFSEAPHGKKKNQGPGLNKESSWGLRYFFFFVARSLSQIFK